jgi:hypothetical protein
LTRESFYSEYKLTNLSINSKFFSKKGAANSSPPQQSKLSFSTKSLQRPKVSEDEAITHGGRKSLESEDKGSNKEREESDISNRNGIIIYQTFTFFG